MGLFGRFSKQSGTGRLRVLALGSCRVHDPLEAMHRLGKVDHLARRIKSRTPIYLHDIHEMIQFVGLLSGKSSMPVGVMPFAFRDWTAKRQMPALLDEADRLVIEVCTDKRYAAMGHALNVNEIHRQLVETTGAAGEAWWNDVHAGRPPTEHAVRELETTLRGAGKLSEIHQRMLREIVLTTLSAAAIAEGLARLKALVRCPILVVPHVAVRLPDGSLLTERLEHIEKTIEAARLAGLAVLDPRSFVDRDGQQQALSDGGTDFHHYAADYLPVVGREIVESLRMAG